MAREIVKSKPFVIGVSGGTGSGKTTMVQAIVNSLKQNDIITIQHDSYITKIGAICLHQK